MRIVVWHGYLLGGTGSNVYARSLARTWSRQGHDVTVVCQEPHPQQYDLAGARVVRPALDGPLPVFVLDRYADARPVLLGDMTQQERQRFVEVNVAAVSDLLPADFVLVNHVLLGGPVGAALDAPFVVKAHGSELEYAMRGNAELSTWGAASLAGARAVLAGSRHVARVLDEVLGAGEHTARVHVVPPGVDVDVLRPQERRSALRNLIRECELDASQRLRDQDERLPDPGNALRLERFLAADVPTVLYVGKVSEEKGVPLLLDALHHVDARAVIAGFGPLRRQLEATSDPSRVLFTGPLEHRHLAHLWPLADVAIVPSVFPEAFGMVAAEAAACGTPPLVANHSGLAEVAAALQAGYPPRLRDLTSFVSGDRADLTAKLSRLLSLDGADRRQLSVAARRTAERHWSWTTVADRIATLAREPQRPDQG